jgi:hypothetical protein
VLTGAVLSMMGLALNYEVADGGGNMYQTINQKASLIDYRNLYQGPVDDLTATIFDSYGLSCLDPVLYDSLKDRVVRAEMDGIAVSDNQVVNAVNWMADQFSAPDFAKSNALQVRVVRATLIDFMPDFFLNKDSQGDTNAFKQEGRELSANFKPAEATCLFLVIVHQKMSNEYFQKPPDVWTTDFYNSQTIDTSNNYQESPSIDTNEVSTQTEQMEQLVFGANLTSSEIANLAHGALDQLGIPR